MSAAGSIDAARLTDGPAWPQGPEPLSLHQERLGPRPHGGDGLLHTLQASGLTGRGGAAFPTWRKWAAVASNARGRGVVVVNASEGEPASRKDQELVRARPHLVLDGAQLAAETVGARRIIIYTARAFKEQRRALERALLERRDQHQDQVDVRIVTCAHRYVAGESSAVVNRINHGIAKPTVIPPRPFERGVDGRPTLVQNAETVAHTALIARFGAAWFREAGSDSSPGTALVTVSGAVAHPGVYEVALGVPLDAVITRTGGATEPVQAVLLGGYFGTWIPVTAMPMPSLDAKELGSIGASVGCGVIAVLPGSVCGLSETARVLTYLAGESAGQCGPCVRGLPALALTMSRIAKGEGAAADRAMLHRWSDEIRGRGECHHPDGALRHLHSALTVFIDDVEAHLAGRPCAPARMGTTLLPVPKPNTDWH